jgi:hypothetical protein
VHSDSALVERRLVGTGALQLGGGREGCASRLAAYVSPREAVTPRRGRGGQG